MNNTSFTLKEVDVHKNSTVLQEASMAYTKDFWKYIQFEELILNDNHKNIVSLPFLANRLNILPPLIKLCNAFINPNSVTASAYLWAYGIHG